MTPDRAALLARVEAFSIDGPNTPALPFAARLARENGWPRPYADRVVREYKRFAFLAAAGLGPVCPSEDVDAAWHLHLTYTRSYWTRFCGEVLDQPLHHEPTKGSPAEGRKHLRMYAHTLAAYREAFGEPPPADIWPTAAERFGDDLRHRVVNTARNWVIPKRPVVQAMRFTAALAGLAVLVPGCDGGLNPLNLVGTDFLGFFLPALLAAIVAGRMLRNARRVPGPYPGDEEHSLTWEQTAYLAGGYPRLTTAGVARLAAARARADQKWVHDAVRSRFGAEAARLEAEGYTLPEGRRGGLGCLAVVPVLLVILGFGVPRLVMGLANHKPVGYLLGAMAVGVFFGVVAAFGWLPRLTRRGEAALRRTRDRHASLRAKADPDMGLAVALFGTAVVGGTGAAFLRMWYPRQAASGSDGGCGSGCGTSGSGGCGGGDGGGGGGCGGGGCGGGGGD
ncbi:TIGR04222 domain-containing membrane protein [bacterium]|nr:TIGR04222 domain-containing membrane protein [bacterium]